MRDRVGAERGRCTLCAQAGVECCEFTFRACGGDEDDDEGGSFPNPEECKPEEYRKAPLLQCLQARLGKDLPVRAAPPGCEGCGCPAEAHEVLAVTESEARILEVARRACAPFELSVCIRQSVQDTSNLGFWRDNFTYGEVNLLSFLRLLDRVRSYRTTVTGSVTMAGKAFYDLGSGVGKCVVAAALHPICFSRCVGVELLPGLHAISRIIAGRFNAEAASAAEACGALPSETIFLEEDLFEMRLTDACFVLLNAGSWREPHLSRLRDYLVKALPDGCLLGTIRQNLTKTGCDELVLVEELRLPMSWGVAPVFLAECRRGTACRSGPLGLGFERVLPGPSLQAPLDLMAMD